MSPDCPPHDTPESRAYRWLRLVKALLAVVVSALTVVELLGGL
ncbi:hypothetical protein [Halegenticoccus tardaugens]|nr:hypothetical protein [Halegenticoccus tardaugens]